MRANGGLVSDGAIPCKRWDCQNPACAPAKLKYYYSIFCNGLGVKEGKDIPNSDDVVLITITTDPKKWRDRAEAWKSIGYSFRLFRQRIFRHYGRFEYIAVTEATKAGYPHIHIVCRGIEKVPQGWHEEYKDHVTGEWLKVTKQSDKEGREYRILRYPSEDGRPTLSQMADDSGFGFVCDIRSVDFDNNKGAANYLLGYLHKSLNSKWYPPNFRRVRFTKGWLRDDWERPALKTGTGLLVLSQEEAKTLRQFVERSSNGALDAEAVIARLNEFGPSKAARLLMDGKALDIVGDID